MKVGATTISVLGGSEPGGHGGGERAPAASAARPPASSRRQPGRHGGSIGCTCVACRCWNADGMPGSGRQQRHLNSRLRSECKWLGRRARGRHSCCRPPRTRVQVLDQRRHRVHGAIALPVAAGRQAGSRVNRRAPTAAERASGRWDRRRGRLPGGAPAPPSARWRPHKQHPGSPGPRGPRFGGSGSPADEETPVAARHHRQASRAASSSGTARAAAQLHALLHQCRAEAHSGNLGAVTRSGSGHRSRWLIGERDRGARAA